MRISVDTNLLQSLLTLATVIEARDHYTGGHTWRVSRYGELLAQAVGLSRDEVFSVKVGGLVHDLGKVGVPDAILNKPGPLVDSELLMMQEHPRIGWGIVASHPLGPLVHAAIVQHHERLNGSGYPKQLNASEWSLPGRILAVADTFDAMTSTRPYRAGLEPVAATALLNAASGTQLDSSLVEAFLVLFREGKLSQVIGFANDSHSMLSCESCGPIIAPTSQARDGDLLACPHCSSTYRLHAAHGHFTLEPSGNRTGLFTPLPDHDAIQSVLSGARRAIHLPFSRSA